MDDGKKKKEDKPAHPRETANVFSALTFAWTLGLFREGNRRDLEVEDLYVPLKEHTSNVLGDRIEKKWREECKRAAIKKREPSLLRVLLRIFGPKLMAYGLVLAIVENVFRVSQPLFLGKLIEYFTRDGGGTVSKDEAYFYAGGVVMCSALSVFIMHPYMLGIMHIGMKIRVACCSLIYRKALRLSKTALGQTTVGQVVNLLSNDVSRFDICTIFVHFLWVGPLETIVVLYFLWNFVGPASVFGVCVLLALIPLQAWLGKMTSGLRMRTALRTDERVRLMNEIISGIQVIKMYTWEKPFAYLVSQARKREIKEIRGASYIRGLLLSFIIFHSRVAIFVSIFVYILMGNAINAEKVFVVTSYFNVLRQTMTVFFPQGIGQVAEVLISIKRLQTFLNYDETTLQQAPEIMKANGTKSEKDEEVEPIFRAPREDARTKVAADEGITVTNATARWTPEVADDSLSHINLRVVPGKLTAIIGPVGSGKTSLLHALLGELPLKTGSVSIPENVSYASQEPWLFAGSVRQNILFGSPYDRERYRQVVRVCALKADFEQFPYGDKTIVGERGVSLSGGQRARINLARAVYKDADVYLLDDPLSAVDTHVGKHLFEDCVTGYLRKKTVILITHQIQYLGLVDHVVVMNNGSIDSEGTYQELQGRNLEFLRLSNSEEEANEEGNQNRNLYKRHASIQSVRSVASSMEDGKIQDEPPEIAEMRSKGTVSGRVYKTYMKSGGNCCMLMFFLATAVLTQLLASGGDYWITYWVNLEEYGYVKSESASSIAQPLQQSLAQPLLQVANASFMTTTMLPSTATNTTETTLLSLPLTRDMCVYVFSAITAATVIVTLFRSYLFFYLCMRASRRLHDTMFNSITRATMHFFNTNSSGRILNRFSKDMGSIDEQLPAALIDCLQIGLSLIGIIVVVGLVNYWLMVPTVFIGILFYFLRNFYLSTSRSVKRLEGVTRSPVFSHLNASLQGLTTIRAFHAQQILEKEFDNHQDLHSSAWYIFIASSRAFGFWLDGVCLIYIALVTFSFLFMGSETFGGNVGLAITQSIGLTGMFQWGMRQSAELENQMTSVERVMEYTDIEKEPPLESPPDKQPPATWPDEGRVTFNRVFLSYGPNEPPVLKNLNFTIAPKEKVGIVGRTGAGKSSLIAALFRLAEVQGEIDIDYIVTSSIGLHELRSKISIIPQEPVLFSGTVRKNLDPFDQYTDSVLWNALEEVELKEVIKDLAGGLNGKMSEGGSNLSVGQRQLVCLARAIVRNNRILVMDEATANVDPQTDGLIQSTIRRKFAECTVLTIAHRLNTVMDSDKVLVMSAGTAVEFNHPHILLQNQEGVLYGMVEQTGKVTRDLLHNIAAASYRRKHKEEVTSSTESKKTS
ncbi:probable multidrug resistance-associated protein lethal(2)03659 [Macrosteles quadrilineatus]|uniref:probable multidrug resistance-associated protein lethal(2)03659 n=1 Tax=Macrosteles quadrilineatus TaxID=74068 RepID=UPI0023E263A9|nr:probable multidrug resistance-associated protein lethal(2)03659 [Macrosteles quadrilineatus]